MATDPNLRPTPVVVDTDPGVDDAIALLMLMASPHVQILGLTTTAGNVPLARATRNSLAILEYAGRDDIPVHRGAARPVRGRHAYSRHVHTPSGLTRRLPDPRRVAEPDAVRFLAHTMSNHPEPVTLIALGPLTNLSRLMRRYPSALQRAARIIVMGGAVDAPGNATPHTEFNFYSDPTAARRVMESGIPITLIDLAVCRRVAVNRSDAAGITSRNPLGRLAAELLTGWFARDPERQAFRLYDPLAALAATHPDVVPLRQVTIEIDDSDTTDDPDLWGRCNVVAHQTGPIAIAPPDTIHDRAALAAIANLLAWEK